MGMRAKLGGGGSDGDTEGAGEGGEDGVAELGGGEGSGSGDGGAAGGEGAGGGGEGGGIMLFTLQILTVACSILVTPQSIVVFVTHPQLSSPPPAWLKYTLLHSERLEVSW